MPYLLAFGLAIAGYSLLDWGWQRMQHRKVTMASLVIGPTKPAGTINTKVTQGAYTNQQVTTSNG